MERVRVLFMLDYLGAAGGAERFAVGLATHLPPERFAVWMCSTREAEQGPERALEEANVAHIHLGRESWWDVHRFGALASLIRRERIDVIHAHMFGSNAWGTLIGRLSGVPVVVAHETTWSYEGEPIRRFLDGRFIGRYASRFIAVSTRDAERMVSIERVPPDKVLVMPNAYIPQPHPPAQDLRTELGISPSTPLIVSVAVLRRQKALTVLLDAYARVLELIPEAVLAIAGDGECRAELEQYAGQIGLSERVHFLGSRADVDSILQSADVAAMSSDYEGMPLVAYECLANGTPLVATNVGGLPDLIEHGRTGLLVEPRDPEALAGALIELLTDSDRRAEMSRAATTRAEEFTIEAIAGRFADLYEQLLLEAEQSGRTRRR